jgi:hypothetical protein
LLFFEPVVLLWFIQGRVRHNLGFLAIVVCKSVALGYFVLIKLSVSLVCEEFVLHMLHGFKNFCPQVKKTKLAFGLDLYITTTS